MADLAFDVIEASIAGVVVLDRLTPGGQGTTFLVDHTIYGRCVLKLVWPEFRERTLREYDALKGRSRIGSMVGSTDGIDAPAAGSSDSVRTTCYGGSEWLNGHHWRRKM
jgi:hypothetical protein